MVKAAGGGEMSREQRFGISISVEKLEVIIVVILKKQSLCHTKLRKVPP